MVTYSEMFQFCTFVVALVNLIYQILRDRKDKPPTIHIS